MLAIYKARGTKIVGKRRHK